MPKLEREWVGEGELWGQPLEEVRGATEINTVHRVKFPGGPLEVSIIFPGLEICCNMIRSCMCNRVSDPQSMRVAKVSSRPLK